VRATAGFRLTCLNIQLINAVGEVQEIKVLKSRFSSVFSPDIHMLNFP